MKKLSPWCLEMSVDTERGERGGSPPRVWVNRWTLSDSIGVSLLPDQIGPDKKYKRDDQTTKKTILMLSHPTILQQHHDHHHRVELS